MGKLTINGVDFPVRYVRNYLKKGTDMMVLLPTKALPSLIEIFHQLDADKSGQITHDEVGDRSVDPAW